MQAFTIILSWCFIVACACNLGANQALASEQKTVVRLTGNLNSVISENMQAHQKAIFQDYTARIAENTGHLMMC
jgi:hypothetical protein